MIELDIPNDAARIMWSDRGRATHAIVKSICTYSDTDHAFTYGIKKAFSAYDQKFIYEIGKTVYADSFDGDIINMCSHGINFYKDLKIAVTQLWFDAWYNFRVRLFNRHLEKQRQKLREKMDRYYGIDEITEGEIK